jgi:fumarate reductase subunit D
MKTNSTSKIILSGASTIMHSLIVPVFVLLFTIYYRPYGVYDVLHMEHASFAFNATILFCIVLVSISITRGWLYLIAKYREIPKTAYLLWCIGETLAASLFITMYIVLMDKEAEPFFELAGSSFIMMSATCIYPYGFLWLGLELYARDNEDHPVQEDHSLIRFHDEYGKLRFVIAPDVLIFIKSEDNYVQIHYLDKGRPKKFILRSSMRALEETLEKHGLIRCHRSYFINPSFIRIVHRDESGLIVADLNQDGYESIPISRKYQDAITKLL